MRLPSHLEGACPPNILSWLDRVWQRQWTRAQLDYAIAHDIAANYERLRKPVEPTGNDPHSVAGWRRRYEQRLRQLAFAAVTLRLGDPSVPEEDRGRKSAGDHALADTIEMFALGQYDTLDWDDVLAGRMPRSLVPLWSVPGGVR